MAGSPSENGMGLLIPAISAVPMVTGAVFPKQTTVGCLSVAAHTACLPLSLDGGIGVYVCVCLCLCLAQLFPSLSRRFICLSLSSIMPL